MTGGTVLAPDAEKAARKSRAALVSILASVAITLGKGITGFLTGSLALISDAAHSLLDVAATTMTWLVVRAADKPADETHPYGHGKIESLAALVETVLLFLLSGAVAYEGVRRLWAGEADVKPSWLAVAVLLAAIVVDAWRWWSLTRVARETGSEALAADALHFSSDLVNSALILVAFALTVWGYPQADALVAIGVSLFIALAGFRLLKRTIDTLTDAAPTDLARRIEARVGAMPGVITVDGVKLRPVGGSVVGEIGIRVPRTQGLEEVARLKDDIAGAIAAEAPNAAVTITANPIALDDETIRERLALIAARARVPVHHITVQHVEGRLSIGCDIELDGRLPLGEAHEIASRFEIAVRGEFGAGIEVETHIEPLEIEELAGAEAEPEARDVVAGVLAGCARETGLIEDVHSVRVRRTAQGLVVNYHCRVDPARDVATVHAQVDRIEQVLKETVPDIARVVGHAEPMKR